MAKEKISIITTSFFGTVEGLSKLTLVSKRLVTSFKTLRVRATFAPGVQRLMKLYFFISPDDSAPTNQPPTGVNILERTGQASFLTGDDDFKEAPVETDQIASGAYLKVYAVNEDTFPHTVDAQITIELLYSENEE